jgi:hypothetical protein
MFLNAIQVQNSDRAKPRAARSEPDNVSQILHPTSPEIKNSATPKLFTSAEKGADLERRYEDAGKCANDVMGVEVG